MTTFGIPNGVIHGVERDIVAEPDVSDASPFDDGVENGDVDREAPLVQKSNVEANFKVEDAMEEVVEEPVIVRPVFSNTDILDPDVEGEETSPSLEDLDDEGIVTGEDFTWVDARNSDGEDETFIEQDFEFYSEDEEYSDLEDNDEELDAMFSPDGKGLLS